MDNSINIDCVNIIELITLSDVKDIVDIILKVVTIMGLIRGLFYLKTLKEKTSAATFSFWSQFRVRLYELSKWLGDDYSLLDNFYKPDSRRSWESTLSSSGDKKKAFKERIEELLIFLKTTSDQMPAYVGWTEDYNKLLEFLNDAVKYDICNRNDFFKFKEEVSMQKRNEYCKEICGTIDNLCKGIEEKQKRIEKKILK